MFLKLKRDTFVRIYGDSAYIVNKTTFSDRVTDKSGAVFLCALSREPKTLDEIAETIAESFIDVDLAEIKQDAVDFFAKFEKDGFIVSAETREELEKKDKGFSYDKLSGILKSKSLSLSQADTDTQTYLNSHFQNEPKLMSFHIELTSRCNERCVHCYVPHEAKTTDIAPALFYTALEQCREMGVLDITFSGGEPLLHPGFCAFLRKAKEYDFSVCVLSNLTLFNDTILSTIKAGNLSSVNVSLYSMKPEIHDSITKLPGSFEKTKSGILKLIDNNIPVQLNCPVMKQNKNCYKDVLLWGHEKKCRVLTDFMIMARSDHNTDNLLHRLSPEETGEVIADIAENDIVYQQRLMASDFETSYVGNKDISEDPICGVCITFLGMVSNGNIYPCPGWQDYVCGNIGETHLKEIWEKSPQINYLRKIRRKDFPQCLNCEDRGFCALCMGRNANEDPNGNFFNINDHFCKVAAINRKIALEWRTKYQDGGKQ
jgi:radical SAM protein with 4Fe4S-binding SPASM domain